MAIVKRLVDYLGGEISIESTPGVGTKVSVNLKFKISEYNEKAKRTRNSRKSVVGKKILVVEDNDLNREIIVSILREEGVEPEEAVNGLNALNIIKSKGPGYYSAILMDIQMPVMGGYEATAEIRRMDEFKNLPIIALSANAFEEDKKKSMKAGMSAHIAKPINVKELMETLKKSAI